MIKPVPPDPAPLESLAKDAAGVRIFPPAVPLLALALGYGLQRQWPIPNSWLFPGAPGHWLGGVIVAISIAGFGFLAVREMRASGQSENPFKPTTSIVSTGPYRLSRNPMYLQMVLVVLGCAIAFSNPWMLALMPATAIALHALVIAREEAYLERKFGADYLAYKRRVRRWI